MTVMKMIRRKIPKNVHVEVTASILFIWGVYKVKVLCKSSYNNWQNNTAFVKKLQKYMQIHPDNFLELKVTL